MDLRKSISAIFHVSMATVSLLATFYTIADLMLFLSRPIYASFMEKKTDAPMWTWSLIINICLLSFFVLQHTFLALPKVKQRLHDLGLTDLQRTLYIILTAFTLQILIKNWQYITDYNLWEFKLYDSPIVNGLYFTVHALSWISIYMGSICMDINELLGLKQIYYKLRNLPEPLTFKTRELKKLYFHMRHPSFVGFIVIFWFFPIMSLDRVLLNSFLTLYMYICWKTDDNDFHYQKLQFYKKFDTNHATNNYS